MAGTRSVNSPTLETAARFAAAIAGVVRRVLSTKRLCEIGDIVDVLEVEANNAKKIVS
jgi:hypothetical protein